MGIALLFAGAAIAAAAVWLTVRIVNRREQWARWSLATLVGVPVLYVLSFGPACRLADRGFLSLDSIMTAYRPVLFLANESSSRRDVIHGYAKWCGGEGTFSLVIQRELFEKFITLPPRISYRGGHSDFLDEPDLPSDDNSEPAHDPQ